MCEMCLWREESSYQACDGCCILHDKSELQQYDILKEWGHLAEWIECKRNAALFCANCVEATNAYRESIRAQAAETEPSGLYLPVHREIKKPDAIPIAIKAEGKTLGLKCAREVYGDEAVEEILRGFVYQDHEMPERIRRLTLADTDEAICCERCWRRLWVCNSMEVTR